MVRIPGTNVLGKIAPFDTSDTYPTHVDIYGKGGFRVVADNTERNAISTDRCSAGMFIHVLSSGITYVLKSGFHTPLVDGDFDIAISPSGGDDWSRSSVDNSLTQAYPGDKVVLKDSLANVKTEMYAETFGSNLIGYDGNDPTVNITGVGSYYTQGLFGSFRTPYGIKTNFAQNPSFEHYSEIFINFNNWSCHFETGEYPTIFSSTDSYDGTYACELRPNGDHTQVDQAIPTTETLFTLDDWLFSMGEGFDPAYYPTRTGDAHGGSYAVKFNGAGGGNMSLLAQSYTGLTPTDSYTCSFWAKGDGVETIQLAYLYEDSGMYCWNFTGPLAGTWSVADIETEHLLNGDFESWTLGLPDNWNTMATGPGTPTYTQELVKVHGGTSSCKITGDAGTAGMVLQAITGLSSGEEVSASVWIAGDIGYEHASVVFLDQSSSFIWNFTTQSWDAFMGSPTADQQIERTLTTSWEEVETDVDAYTDGSLMIGIVGDNTGSIYVDDASLLTILRGPQPDQLYTVTPAATYTQYTTPVPQVIVPTGGGFTLGFVSFSSVPIVDDIQLLNGGIGPDIAVNGDCEDWTSAYAPHVFSLYAKNVTEPTGTIRIGFKTGPFGPLGELQYDWDDNTWKERDSDWRTSVQESYEITVSGTSYARYNAPAITPPTGYDGVIVEISAEDDNNIIVDATQFEVGSTPSAYVESGTPNLLHNSSFERFLNYQPYFWEIQSLPFPSLNTQESYVKLENSSDAWDGNCAIKFTNDAFGSTLFATTSLRTTFDEIITVTYRAKGAVGAERCCMAIGRGAAEENTGGPSELWDFVNKQWVSFTGFTPEIIWAETLTTSYQEFSSTIKLEEGLYSYYFVNVLGNWPTAGITGRENEVFYFDGFQFDVGNKAMPFNINGRSNILENPSFEDYQSSPSLSFDNWETFDPSTGSGTIEVSSDAEDRNTAVKATVDGSGNIIGLYQDVTGLNPGFIYCLSVYAKGSGAPGQFVYMAFSDGDDKYYNLSAGTWDTVVGPPTANYVIGWEIGGTYERKSENCYAPENGTIRVNIFAGFDISTANNVIYFDAAQLEAADAPTTFQYRSLEEPAMILPTVIAAKASDLNKNDIVTGLLFASQDLIGPMTMGDGEFINYSNVAVSDSVFTFRDNSVSAFNLIRYADGYYRLSLPGDMMIAETGGIYFGSISNYIKRVTSPSTRLEISDTVYIAGDLTVNGSISGGSFNISSLHLTGDLDVDGNTTLGDIVGMDTLTVNAVPTFNSSSTFKGTLSFDFAPTTGVDGYITSAYNAVTGVYFYASESVYNRTVLMYLKDSGTGGFAIENNSTGNRFVDISDVNITLKYGTTTTGYWNYSQGELTLSGLSANAALTIQNLMTSGPRTGIHISLSNLALNDTLVGNNIVLTANNATPATLTGTTITINDNSSITNNASNFISLFQGGTNAVNRALNISGDIRQSLYSSITTAQDGTYYIISGSISDSANGGIVYGAYFSLTDNTTSTNHLDTMKIISGTVTPRDDAYIEGLFLNNNGSSSITGHAIRILGYWPYGLSLVGDFSRMLNLSGTGTLYAIYVADQPKNGIYIANCGSSDTDAYAIWVKSRGATDISNLGTSGAGIYSEATDAVGIAGVFVNSNASPTRGYAIYGKSADIVAVFTREDATSDNLKDLVILNAMTTGTAAQSLGGTLAFNIQNSIGVSSRAVNIDVAWDDPIEASKTSTISIFRYQAGSLFAAFSSTEAATSIGMIDNQSEAFKLVQGSNVFISATTTNDAERVNVFENQIPVNSRQITINQLPSSGTKYFWNMDAESAQGAGTYSGTKYGGIDITVVGEIGMANDAVGSSRAVDFDGTNDYAYSSDSNLGWTGDGTLSIWAYKSDWTGITSPESLVSRESGGDGYYFRLDDGYLKWIGFQFTSTVESLSAPIWQLAPGWHRFTIIRDSGNYVKLRIDGKTVAMSYQSATIGSAGSFTIGARGAGSDKFTGRLDEIVYVKNYAMTDEEDTLAYARTSGKPIMIGPDGIPVVIEPQEKQVVTKYVYNSDVDDSDVDNVYFDFVPTKITYTYTGFVLHDTSFEQGTAFGHGVINLDDDNVLSLTNDATSIINNNGTTGIPAAAMHSTTKMAQTYGGHDGTDQSEIYATPTWDAATQKLTLTWTGANIHTSSNVISIVITAYK